MNLKEILQSYTDWADGYDHKDGVRKLNLEEAEQAIIEWAESKAPAEKLKRNGDPTTNMATAEYGHNQCRQQYIANLEGKE